MQWKDLDIVEPESGDSRATYKKSVVVMKLTDKRFWILLIVMAYASVAPAQTVFSVEKISETEYVKAERECSRYNVIPADSIVDNDIVSMVLKESQAKFERLDSAWQQEIIGIYDNPDFGFNKRWLTFLPELKLYGFIIPESPHDDAIWWFDSENGKYICRAACPTAVVLMGFMCRRSAMIATGLWI